MLLPNMKVDCPPCASLREDTASKHARFAVLAYTRMFGNAFPKAGSLLSMTDKMKLNQH